MTATMGDGLTLSKDLDRLREDFQRIRREVDKLQFKLDWYEKVAKNIVYVAVFFFVAVATKHAKNDSEPGHNEYKIVDNGNTRYEGVMKFGHEDRLRNRKKEQWWVRNGFGYEYITHDRRKIKKEGYYQNDKMEGYGVFTEGQFQFEGQWKDDKMNGYGFQVYSDGTTYSGAYVNNNREGYGIAQWANGDRYEGMWVDDHLNDTTIRATFANQSQYVGSYYNKTFNGYGIYIWPDGIRYEAIWKDGRPVSGGTFLVPMFHSIKGSLVDYEEIISNIRQQDMTT